MRWRFQVLKTWTTKALNNMYMICCGVKWEIICYNYCTIDTSSNEEQICSAMLEFSSKNSLYWKPSVTNIFFKEYLMGSKDLKIWVIFLSLLTQKVLFLQWINHLKTNLVPLFTPKSEVNAFQSDRNHLPHRNGIVQRKIWLSDFLCTLVTFWNMETANLSLIKISFKIKLVITSQVLKHWWHPVAHNVCEWTFLLSRESASVVSPGVTFCRCS